MGPNQSLVRKVHRARLPAMAALLLTGLLGVSVAGCTTTPKQEDRMFVVPEKVEAAKTPEDNEALARYYEEQAAAARLQGDKHRELLKTYQYGTFAHRYQKGGHIPVMERHCEALIGNSEEAARIYSGMAAEHRRLAAPSRSE